MIPWFVFGEKNERTAIEQIEPGEAMLFHEIEGEKSNDSGEILSGVFDI
jgi:hypothetical protein